MEFQLKDIRSTRLSIKLMCMLYLVLYKMFLKMEAEGRLKRNIYLNSENKCANAQYFAFLHG